MSQQHVFEFPFDECLCCSKPIAELIIEHEPYNFTDGIEVADKPLIEILRSNPRIPIDESI